MVYSADLGPTLSLSSTKVLFGTSAADGTEIMVGNEAFAYDGKDSIPYNDFNRFKNVFIFILP